MKKKTILLALFALALALSVALFVAAAADARGGGGPPAHAGGPPAHAGGPPAHARAGGDADPSAATSPGPSYGQAKRVEAKAKQAEKSAARAAAKAARKAEREAAKAEKSAERAVAEGTSPADAKNHAWACMLERAQMGGDRFRDEYGTNRDERNAFGKCVSTRARSTGEEREERDEAACEPTDDEGSRAGDGGEPSTGCPSRGASDKDGDASPSSGEGVVDPAGELGGEAAALFAVAFS